MASELKKMWGIYRETGIFVAACQHGLILWLADMIESGELAKYLLAITAKILEHLGDKNILAYDIGCTFDGTLSHSLLANLAKEQSLHCCVNAFHGTAHNAACQSRYHPDIIPGMGLEDLETLERTFSTSNQVAAVTQYASTLHRHQFINLHFRQWDEDKYMNIAKMVYNNYQQALDITHEDSPAITEAAVVLSVDPNNFEAWEKEQAEYFTLSSQEPEEIVLAITYVELLQDLRSTESSYSNVASHFMSVAPVDFINVSSTRDDQYARELSKTHKAETSRHIMAERREHILRDIVEMEVRMGVTARWQPQDKKYIETLKYIAERKYHRCLDDLQRLVIS
ncbi:hypothetical protein FISHEDRAFT_75841 [Fistulina hepatica ATCC 64428]|uniref:Uncharacterized protein n=1 Tax=Fistulina hepatica ATCC 64428 TaxID=1128425 RepID=A0A0D7A8I1_9AGAR|nr:hypothetical protein FISHEDRAFT_75841 [Fistulina hepatica ATCC 64428]